jgi:hypothetical protein
MKTKITLAAFALVALLALVGFTYQTQPAQPVWEYTVISLEPKLEDRFLKELGRGGWELVTITSDRDGKTFYFKRPAK